MSPRRTAPDPGKWRYAKAKQTPGKQCKDCLAEGYTHTKRPAPYPGPRCASHDREKKRAARMARAVKHVEATYELTDEEYNTLYRLQGGVCYICRRAKGTTKRLAVDHDHRRPCTATHGQKKGCRSCVRGLLCSPCNDTIAHLRDDPAAGHRIAEYLTDPPWRRLNIV